MSACKEFEANLADNLSALYPMEQNAEGEANAANPILAILLPALIDIGTQLLTRCREQNGLAKTMQGVFGENFGRRMVVNRAMRTSEIPREHRGRCRDALLTTVDQQGPDKVKACAAELDAVPSIDWSAW